MESFALALSNVFLSLSKLLNVSGYGDDIEPMRSGQESKQAGAVRASVLAAAWELLGQGPANVTSASVAQAAGVSRRTVTRVLGTGDLILAKTADARVDALLTELRSARGIRVAVRAILPVHGHRAVLWALDITDRGRRRQVARELRRIIESRGWPFATRLGMGVVGVALTGVGEDPEPSRDELELELLEMVISVFERRGVRVSRRG